MSLPGRAILLGFTFLLVLYTDSKLNGAEYGARAPSGNYDVRIQGRGELDILAEAYSREVFGRMVASARLAEQRTGEALVRLHENLPQARLQRSDLVGAAEVVSAPGSRLTPGDRSRTATEIARGFMTENGDLYGLNGEQVARLRIRGESLSRQTGLRVVRIEQTVDDRPVFQSETRIAIDRDGRLIRTVGRLVPGLDEPLAPRPVAFISPQAALASAMLSVGIDLDVGRMRLVGGADGPSVQVVVNDPRIVLPVTSEIVYFPLAAGVVIPAWSQVTRARASGAWYTLVDGRTGVLLYRKDIRAHASTQPARFSVYAQSNGAPADSPAPASPSAATPASGTQFPAIARLIESMSSVQDPIASPNGWIPDGGSTTTGNNVDAYLDRNGDFQPDLRALDSKGRPVGNPDASGRNRDFLGSLPRNYSYVPAPVGNNPDAGDDPANPPSQRGGITNLFYITNWYHDRLYRLGFDEAAGNFQLDNFMRGGAKGDAVHAEAQWGADAGFSDDSFFETPPDGAPGVMAIELATGPTPDRDLSLEALVVVHELTHGLSNRLIGNAAGLNWSPGFGMGEGWSDFMAQALLNAQPSDDPKGVYPDGPWSSYRIFGSAFTDNYFYGFRRFPYTIDHTLNPLTWADADQTTLDYSGGVAVTPRPFPNLNLAIESHNLGEIWANTLWDVRARVIAANGNVAAGNDIMLGIVVDAMKMTPIDPSFAQARDALIDADCADHACANEESIRAGFAARGLGYAAESSLGIAFDAGIGESVAVPNLDVAGLTVDDSAGNGNGFIDPGETVSIRVNLLNPWRSSSKGVSSASATLSSSNNRIMISDSKSSYGPIPAQGTGTGDPFAFTLRPGIACGQSLDFTLQTTSALGTSSVPLSLRVGRPAGPGAPVALTHLVPGGLGIPDGSTSGAVDSFTVADDLQIGDLDFRVDSLTHPNVSELCLELKSPAGFGADLICGVADCSGHRNCTFPASAPNFVSTRIDDSSTNDLFTAGGAAAPYMGAWFPVFNSSTFTSVFDGGHADPLGQLSHYRGPTTRGTWQVLAVDAVSGNAGTLDSWSLVVTPTTFVCSP